LNKWWANTEEKQFLIDTPSPRATNYISESWKEQFGFFVIDKEGEIYDEKYRKLLEAFFYA
jgi:hypothetical protein